ncbi:MAG TPA: hypothetical protein VGQ25_02095 [Gemmatimonadales bacterium]|jgi:hypothetical protein|nr:hypothetical protein [Gemmatimonadales bacterium]
MLVETQWLVLGGGLAVAGAIALAVRAAERKRRAAYEEFCLIRGFQFERERPDGERRFREFFELFDQGRRRQWGFTIGGRLHGFPFTAFEYKWVTGGGKNSSTHRIGGIVWEREQPALPKFALSPEGWFTRVGAVFGMQDIDFDESPEFSRAYRLKGPDEAAIRALMTPEIRHFFAATPDQHVAGGGRFLFWWRNGRLPTGDRLDEWLEQGDQVRRRFFKD